MQDPEIPPEAGGEAGGGAVGVRPIIAAVAADMVAIVKIQAAASTVLPWITAIVLCWEMATGTKAAAACAPVSPPAIQ